MHGVPPATSRVVAVSLNSLLKWRVHKRRPKCSPVNRSVSRLFRFEPCRHFKNSLHSRAVRTFCPYTLWALSAPSQHAQTPSRSYFSTCSSRQRPPPERPTSAVKPQVKPAARAPPPPPPRGLRPPFKSSLTASLSEPEFRILTGDEIIKLKEQQNREKQDNERREEQLLTEEKRRLNIRLAKLRAIEEQANLYNVLNEFPRKSARKKIRELLDKARTYGKREASLFFEQFSNISLFLDQSPREISDHLNTVRDEARQEWTWIQRYQRIYRPIDDQLGHVAQVLNQFGRTKQAFKDTFESMIWTLYYTQELLPFIEEVENSEIVINGLDQQTRNIRYRIDWWSWYTDKVDVEADAMLDFEKKLKTTKQEHHRLDDVLGICHENYSQLISLFASPFLLQPQPQSPEIDLTQGDVWLNCHLLDCEQLAYDTVVYGHYYRGLNLIGQSSLYAPIVTAHHAFRIKFDDLLMKFNNSREAIRLSLDRIHTFQRLGCFRRDVSRLISSCREVLGKSRDIYSDLSTFANRGMILSNPNLQSYLGISLFAGMSSNNIYFRARQDFYDYVLQILRDHDDLQQSDNSSHHSTPRMIHKDSMVKNLKAWSDDFKHSRRELRAAITAFETRFITRFISRGRLSTVPQSLLQEQARCRSEFNLIQDCARLQLACQSRQPTFGLPSYPFPGFSALRSSCTLYPMSPSIPVELTIDALRVSQVLNSLNSQKVVGIDLVSRSSRGNTDHLVVATATKIHIIFLDAGRVDLYRAVTDFLENHRVLKIVYDWDSILLRWRRLLSSLSIVDLRFLYDNKAMHRQHADAARNRAKQVSSLSLRGRMHSGIGADRAGLCATLHHLALQPMTHLLNFLNFYTQYSNASADHVVSDELHHSIHHVKELIEGKIDKANGNFPQLGPLDWDTSPLIPARFYVKSASSSRSSVQPRSLLECLKAEAKEELDLLDLKGSFSLLTKEERKSERAWNALVAYYLYTSFNQDLRSLRNLLGLAKPAQDIAWITVKLNKALSSEHGKAVSLSSVRREVTGTADMPESTPKLSSIRRRKRRRQQKQKHPRRPAKHTLYDRDMKRVALEIDNSSNSSPAEVKLPSHITSSTSDKMPGSLTEFKPMSSPIGTEKPSEPMMASIDSSPPSKLRYRKTTSQQPRVRSLNIHRIGSSSYKASMSNPTKLSHMSASRAELEYDAKPNKRLDVANSQTKPAIGKRKLARSLRVRRVTSHYMKSDTGSEDSAGFRHDQKFPGNLQNNNGISQSKISIIPTPESPSAQGYQFRVNAASSTTRESEHAKPSLAFSFIRKLFIGDRSDLANNSTVAKDQASKSGQQPKSPQ